MKVIIQFAIATLLVLLLKVNSYSQELPCKSYYPREQGGRCKERYKEDENGLIHGKYISYEKDGSVETRGSFVHGVKQGNWYDRSFFDGPIGYRWYENGSWVIAGNDQPISSYTEAQKLVREYQKEETQREEKKRKERAKQDSIEHENTVKLSRESRELDMWNEAIRKSKDEMNPVYLENYMREFPNSRYISMAKAQIRKIESMKPDNDAFQIATQTNSIDGYNRYLKDFPNGIHRNDAESGIKIIKDKPDHEAFQAASKKNTTDDYLNYLIEYPEGIHKNEVVAVLQEYMINNVQNLEPIRDGIEADIFSNSKNGFIKAFIKCQLIMSLQGRYNLQEFSVVTMYMIICKWALDDVEGAREIFSEQGKRYQREAYNKGFDSVYKLFKKKITLPDEKANYKVITSKAD
ncbi:MAG: hypothetical protein OJF59_000627 [Cytophagales bacterium]|jgi:hypothetical protein|nr:MAG: hypothetical protein OJF59_000627 [Cytophagales bacterium]